MSFPAYTCLLLDSGQDSSQVEQWYNQMLQVCAGSPKRRTMEFRGYFAPGELD